MKEQIESMASAVNGIVWGPAMIVFLVGAGVYLTIRLGFIQFRYLRHSIRCVSGKYDNPEESGDITHFQALAAALSATIGTGNIAGVATAIALGGPGAVFWMWVTALVGMATKYTSCSLALKYRVIHEDGSASGGPMYFLSMGLGQKWLGVLFALFAGLASLGIGCAVQSNSVVDGVLSLAPSEAPRTGLKVALGAALAVLVGLVIIGGIKRIARVASRVVPFMCAVYILGALIVLIRFADQIPGAFAQIFTYAFSPVAVGGGFVGAVIQQTLRYGVARGVFSNESGLGSAPMAHAAAKTTEMAREGFVAMLGPFIDTIIVCTMTALVIVSTGVWQVRGDDDALLYGPGGEGAPMQVVDAEGKSRRVVGSVGEEATAFTSETGDYYAVPTGAALTASGFEQGLGRTGKWIVAIGLALFAYSTMISWSYYGDRCWEYLLGSWAITPYRIIFCCFAVLGAGVELDLVWNIADSLNALMAIPNLIALLALSGVVAKETRDYVARMKERGDM